MAATGARTYGEAARPFAATLDSSEPSASAIMYMQGDQTPLLPVVAPGTGEFVGVVLRSDLDSECRGLGHTPAVCPIGNHVVTDMPVRYSDQPLDQVRTGGDSATPGPAAGGLPHPLTDLAVVVLDRERRPVGFVSADGAPPLHGTTWGHE